MSATNRTRHDGSEYQRDAADYYRTPAWAVEAIRPYLPSPECMATGPGSQALLAMDAGSGDGAIADALVGFGYPRRSVVCVERELAHVEATREKGYATVHADYLTHVIVDPRPDVVVMNPPYGQAMEFVQRAMAGGRMGAFALLRLPFLESRDRYVFHNRYPAHVVVLPKRPSFTKDGKTDATAYAWFMWAIDPSTGRPLARGMGLTLPRAMRAISPGRWDVAEPPAKGRR